MPLSRRAVHLPSTQNLTETCSDVLLQTNQVVRCMCDIFYSIFCLVTTASSVTTKGMQSTCWPAKHCGKWDSTTYTAQVMVWEHSLMSTKVIERPAIDGFCLD